ncbi:MAG: SIS domain-containing protein [Candidatus Peribacteria bacterium]|nr:MAG: SIS domain-containing protein [Candidatus Peribacteria bacterium]
MSYKRIMRGLEQLPMQIEALLNQSEYIRSVAAHLSGYSDLFFLGRWLQLPIAYEASLKLKEISYLHSEAYPLGELKHGPLSLIDEQVPSVLFMPKDDLWEKNLSSLQEIKARSGKILAISDVPVHGADRQISVPTTIPELSPLLSAIAGQLLAYHIADLLHRDIDTPRNLAKSVTVK